MQKQYGKIKAALCSIFVVLDTILWGTICSVLAVFSRNTGLSAQKIWAKQLLWSFGADVSLTGQNNIKPDEQYVFVSNHQSHLDIPSLMSVLPMNLTFIAKKELFAIPILGWGMSMVGHIPMDRSSARNALKSMAIAAARLKTGKISTVIFPEGTRSRDGSIGEFKRGSFALAIKSGLKVVPVFIDGTGRVLAKKSKTITPGKILIKIGEPIQPDASSAAAKEQISQIVLDKIILLSKS